MLVEINLQHVSKISTMIIHDYFEWHKLMLMNSINDTF